MPTWHGAGASTDRGELDMIRRSKMPINMVDFQGLTQ